MSSSGVGYGESVNVQSLRLLELTSQELMVFLSFGMIDFSTNAS